MLTTLESLDLFGISFEDGGTPAKYAVVQDRHTLIVHAWAWTIADAQGIQKDFDAYLPEHPASMVEVRGTVETRTRTGFEKRVEVIQ